MKKLIKAALRPILRPFDSWMFSRVAPRARSISGDIIPGLDGLLRELTRLQDRIDALESAIANRNAESRDSERAKAG